MLEKKKIKGAVDAVLSLIKAKDDTSLVDLPKKIDVQFTMKQIPKIKHKNILIELPTSIHYELREVCIFVKDLDKNNREYEATVQHYEDLFRTHKINSISKIVPLKALRTDYSLPSSKVQLAKAYDLYLADGSVLGMLPGLLGKVFYAKKKTVPVKVDLKGKNLKAAVDKVVNNTRCTIQGTGSSCLVTVAHDRMEKKDIVENVKVACEYLMEQIPGGKGNIRNIYIKSADSTSVPIYLDTETANDVKLPKVKRNKVAQFVDEVTTVEGGKVMIKGDGQVRFIKDEENIKESPKGTQKKKKGKETNDQDSEEDTNEIKEEIDDSIEFGKTAGEDVDDDDNGVEVLDSDDDDKDNLKAEIKKKSEKMSGKKQKKRKSEGVIESVTVDKKKQKWTEVAAKRDEKTPNKKSKKARKT